jgi:putative PIN family toxin of toxin-antitoxin system
MAGDISARVCVALDTTTLVRAIPTRSPLRPIIKAFDDRRFILVVSNEILLEYEEILGSIGGPLAWPSFRALLDAHDSDVKYVDPSYRWDAIPSDRDDNKFVDAAVAGDAEWIVTDDSHFNVLNTSTSLVVRPLHPRLFIERYCGA